MKKHFIESLVEPHSKEPCKVNIEEESGDHIIIGNLECGEKKFPILGGIPRFVDPEFYELSEESDSDTDQTIQSFGAKWKGEEGAKAGKNPDHVTQMYEEQMMAMLGVDTMEELKALFKDGMTAIDIGCGVGWAEESFNFNPNCNYFGLDMSLSTEVAYENTKDMDNVCITQASVFDLPFPTEYFDIIFSNGVLHHTGDTRGAFDNLCEHLKPGGLIGVYIYCIKPLLREMADKEVRKITTKMTNEECMKFSSQLSSLGKALQQIKEPLVLEEDVELLGMKKGEYNLQKFIYDHFIKCYYNNNFGHDFSTITNLDWYHPAVAEHYSKEELLSWFEENGIENVKCLQPKGYEHSGFFVSGRKKA